MDKTFVIAVEGPTASGKTGLGVRLAEHYGGEVVSADSMQIYKKMNIATAKPTKEEMQGVPHHLIDFVEPTESYSVARYKSDAVKAINDISSRGKIPIIVGGTGLYIDSLLENVEFFDIGADEEIRRKLFERAESEGADKLYSELKSVDPESAEKMHANNIKKVIRALEFYYQTGKTISEQVRLSKLSGTPFESVIICLTANNRQILYDRINTRVDKMIEDGLVEEARMFYSVYGVKTANQAIGYKELLPYLEGKACLEECIERLKMQTRRYAKRQLTWFRRNENANMLCIDETNSDGLLKRAIEIIDSRRTL